VLPGEVRALHASADGALWLITDGGFATLRDTTWQVTRAELGGELAGVDDLGRVWVVSDDGAAISAFHRRQDGSDDDWTSTTYGADAGWRTVASADAWHREIGPVETDGAGRVWLATSQDVRVFDAERWTVLTPAEMGMGEIGPRETWATLTLELAQSSGTVWVGACDWGGPGPLGGQGVRWFEGGSWRGADAPVAAGCATAIAEDRQGRVWMAVDERVWRYTPTSGTWTELAPPEPPMADVRFGFVQAMALDPSGDPWPAMVLCGGASCYGSIALYHVEDGTWVRMGEPLDFGGGLPPHRLIPDTRGVRWIIWAGSLHRVAGEALSEPVTDLGLIRHAVVDDAGRAWFVAPFEGREMLWTLKPSS
jgi:ligand-binding sensor domain-containing protein